MSGQTQDPVVEREPQVERSGRWRWALPAVLLLVWLAIGGIGGQYQGRLAEVQKNDNASFLPADTESTKVLELQQEFAESEALPAFVVVEGDGPLTPEQLAAVEAFAEEIPTLEVPVAGEQPRTVGDFLVEGPVSVLPSQDGEAALLLVQFDGDTVATPLPDGEDPLLASVEQIREAEKELEAEGLDVYVAGPGGQLADFIEAFGEIDGILLGVALLAVLIILLIVYRSPVLPLMVILSAVFALALASVVVYFLADAGTITLNGQSQGILFILVVGAATDYALLLVSRFKEELRRHDDRYTAMRVAWRRTLEPVVASGVTVILGLLCLLVSDLNSTRSLGPVGALGVAASVLSALTFLPAMLLLPGPFLSLLLLSAAAGAGAVIADSAELAGAGSAAVGALVGAAIAAGLLLLLSRRAAGRRRARASHGDAVEAGRWVFWPGVPHVGSEGSDTRGIWARVSGLVGRHPRRVWALTALGLGLLAAFLPMLKADGVAQSDLFLTEVESVTGQEALARHFPAGSGSPTVVIGPADRIDEMVSVAEGTDGVDSAGPAGQGAPGTPPKVVDGQVELSVVLTDAADSPAAEETVRALRVAMDEVSPDILVGGNTAINLDVRDTSVSDRNKVIPLVLAVIFVVLALLLRALVAPLVLLVANVLSFAATLGASALVFDYVFDFPGGDPSVPLFGFVFLVALGIDYSIFLMTRVREESVRRGTRPGILIGLAVTGGVITSAGVVLAATFSALGVLPILFLAQIAFIVAFGVLLDTLVVRSLLVPALSYDIGPRIWWPSRLARAEQPVPEQPEPATVG